MSERTSSDICRHFFNLIELLWTISLFSPPILLLCIVTKIFLHIYYGIQVKLDFSLQLSSSDPSPQSSLPSQRWRSSTQASLLHFTIPAEQFSPETGADDQEKIKNYHLWICLLELMDCKTLCKDLKKGRDKWDLLRGLQGRAQSRNSSWSMATSPLCPTDRSEWRRIWKVEGIRPRKMRASLQARTLEASGRQTTASSPPG